MTGGDLAETGFFGAWLSRQRLAGVRLVLMEGMTQAGKSELTKGLPSWVSVLELDCLLDDGELSEEDWADAVIRKGAFAEVERLLAFPMVIAEGVAAWRVFDARVQVPTRRVYVTRLDIHGVDADRCDLGDFAPAVAKPLAESHRHHLEDRPWEQADLHIQRVDIGNAPSIYRVIDQTPERTDG